MLDTKNCTSFKSYSGINRAAILNGRAHILRVWYLLRFLDSKGSSWFSKDMFLTAVQSIGLSLRRSEQIYHEGMEIYWEEAGNDMSIRIISLYRIAKHLEVFPGYIVDLPVEILQDLTETKAYFYTSFFAKDSWRVVDEFLQPQSGKTISRKMLEKMFGITPKTQKKYEKLANVRVEPQYGFCKVNESNFEKIPFRERMLDDKKCGIWKVDIDHDGKLEYVWQTSNFYNTKLSYSGNANRRMKRYGGLFLRDEAEPNQNTRLYYPNYSSAFKSLKHHANLNPGIYIVSNRKHKIFRKGRLLDYTPLT